MSMQTKNRLGKLVANGDVRFDAPTSHRPGSKEAATMQRRTFLSLLGSAAAITTTSRASAKPPAMHEPVHRVVSVRTPKVEKSALEHGIELARKSLKTCQTQLTDYTAVLVKRERVGGTLGPHEYMSAKVRPRKISNGQVTQPLSVYLGFLKPSTVKGREVIYVEGQNNGKLVAHEGGIKGRFLPTVNLSPTGPLAMRGQRYPLTEIGLQNLLVKLIERGEQAKQFPDVSATIEENKVVANRRCSILTVTQPTKRPELDFYQAKVFMDDELGLPFRYVAYDWPRHDSQEKLEVIEEYTYLNLKVNVGLADADFDADNANYNF